MANLSSKVTPSGVATAAQGAKADSALQSGDNISDLTNDAGFVASGDSPTFGTVTATSFSGDGSGLTGVGAEYYEQTDEPSSPGDGAMWYDPLFSYIYFKTQDNWVRVDAPLGTVGTKDIALLIGGDGAQNTVQSFNIATLSSATASTSQYFGGYSTCATTDGQKAYTGGGYIAYSISNQILTFGFLTGSTSTDFGDLTVERISAAAAASTSRGLFAGGENSTTVLSGIDYITFSVQSNASSFGSLSQARLRLSGTSNGTRAVFGGGSTTGSNGVSTIDYVTIATTGNASYFGALYTARGMLAAVSDGDNAYFAGGSTSSNFSTQVNTIDKVSIATLGNASLTNALSAARATLAGMSNGTRAVFAAGAANNTTSGVGNLTDYITFGTGGTAVAFGGLVYNSYNNAGTSGFSGA